MRELKFRVWTGAEMVYDVMVGKFGAFYVNPSNNGLDPNDSASLTTWNTKYSDSIPIMQFTGLTDAMGKEIYEGDILKHKDGDLHTVEWGHHLWAFIVTNRKPNTNYQDACFPNQFTVIGNIYQK